ncbi:MAG: M14 family metallopeptidase [Ignavibacteriaceae bacterium]|nr:M14 family metallopeptidase [Ignavibacteriaceae bacterium]
MSYYHNNQGQNFDWETHFEKSGYLETPSYNTTIEYFTRLADKSPFAKIVNFGVSHQGRDLKCLICSSTKEIQPKKAKRSGRAIIFIQAGIHAGEIEGKDASMLLLRDIIVTREKEHLLENTILVVIPCLNPDGHERMGANNRPNQLGPTLSGWRTNALNIDLNRDYTKADSAEIKSLLRLWSIWTPDFYIDTHTTNGLDYQYHLSYGIERHHNLDPRLVQFGNEMMIPQVIKGVEDKGFLISPYIEPVSENITDGITSWSYEPRYSTGYAAAQNRLGLLVEAHSLKPYKDRVFATKAILEETIEYINTNFRELKDLNRFADKRAVQKFFMEKKRYPILLEGNSENEPFLFKGYKTSETESIITGKKVIQYTDEKTEFEIPHYNKTEVIKTVKVPDAYLIPAELKWVPRLLKLHGVIFKVLDRDITCEVEKYMFTNVKFKNYPSEGKMQADFEVIAFQDTVKIQRGSYMVPLSQRTIRVLLNLLEPLGPDSLARWGYFNSCMERKEYVEDFVFEPIAREMLEKDDRLREEFYFTLEENPEFKADSTARLDFFYSRSEFADKNENVYPVMRLFEAKRYFSYFDRVQ